MNCVAKSSAAILSNMRARKAPVLHEEDNQITCSILVSSNESKIHIYIHISSKQSNI